MKLAGAVNTQLVTPPNSTELHQHHHSHSHSTPSKTESTQKLIKQATDYIISLTHTSQPPKFKLVLNHYITELLKRSRSSLPIFQIALKYYVTLTDKINCAESTSSVDELICIKKRLLGCLILSFKYHYDCQYSFKSWGKISGLTVRELQKIELQALIALDYQLNLSSEEYQSWLAELTLKMKEFEESSSTQDQIFIAESSCGMTYSKRSHSDSVEGYAAELNKRLKTV
ncbi:hypothetical protein WICPIJ_009112 [Wickerhamomyces pijperi]|uniref:Cyclin N-terminal domain-containing protein n=1 Tax=Wickerhamomyces pijperi TaxID=599730 RepID=A0A9P8TF06_WICPI|nr:hypothetical protein WICPIJ_009112 [Wickerhamomyces pijperi]